MIQDLITYILIAASTAYILFSLYRIAFPAEKGRQLGCTGCTGCQLKKGIVTEKKHAAEIRNDLSLPEFHLPYLIHQVQNTGLPAKQIR